MEMVEQTPQAQGSSVPLVSINSVWCLFSLCLKENREGRENQLSFFQKTSPSYPVSEAGKWGPLQTLKGYVCVVGLLRSGLSRLSS